MNLRDALAQKDSPEHVQSATIYSIDPAGTVGIDFGGGQIVDRAYVLSSYDPVIGAAVEVLQRTKSTWLVLGEIRGSNSTTLGFTRSWAFPYNVTPANPSVADPFVVNANAVRSWRVTDPWTKNEAYQGAYTTTWGYYRGLYFYGNGAFSPIAGATCTGITIRLHRTGSGGNGGAEPCWIAPHVHESVPTGSPYFAESAVNVGSLAWNGVGTFALPTSWGQGLIDGTYKGFGHLYLGTSDYAIFHAYGTDSLTGQLSIGWD